MSHFSSLELQGQVEAYSMIGIAEIKCDCLLLIFIEAFLLATVSYLNLCLKRYFRSLAGGLLCHM